MPFHNNSIILCYKMILLWQLLWNVGIKYHGNLPWYFNLRKSRCCSKLPWYFYNTGKKYHGILTLEKGGTTVNYHSIFITLAPGLMLNKLNEADSAMHSITEIKIDGLKPGANVIKNLYVCNLQILVIS